MGRPKAPAYTLGKVTFAPHPTMPHYRQARGRWTDDNHKRYDWTGSGKTDAAARRDLEAKVANARTTHRGGDAAINHSTKLSKVATVWWEWKQREPLAAGTVREYTRYVTKVIAEGQLGNLPIVEANDIGRVENFLAVVADQRGAQAARQTRKMLNGIFEFAERRKAIPASVMGRVKLPRPSAGSVGDRKCRDDECDLDCGRTHLDTRRAFDAEEASAVMVAAQDSQADVEDLAHFLFGTGVRISEALHHTLWPDVDLAAKTVHVRGTKTASADRVLSLSDDLTERLRARRTRYGSNGLVFGITRYPSKLGQPRDRDNVLRALRRVFLVAGVPWAGSHTFRRTVATWMDENGAPLSEIANQLGHADTNVTAGYLGRKGAASRAAAVMTLPKPPDTRPNLHVVA